MPVRRAKHVKGEEEPHDENENHSQHQLGLFIAPIIVSTLLNYGLNYYMYGRPRATAHEALLEQVQTRMQEQHALVNGINVAIQGQAAGCNQQIHGLYQQNTALQEAVAANNTLIDALKTQNQAIQGDLSKLLARPAQTGGWFNRGGMSSYD